MNIIFTLARLTFKEAVRRRIMVASLVLGLAFVLLFNVGFYYITKEIANNPSPRIEESILLNQVHNFLHLAAMYASNFLVTVFAVLISADVVAGEIGSGVMQVVASKPIHRFQIILGKWLGNASLVGSYLLLLVGGCTLGIYIQSGYVAPNILTGIGLLFINSLVLMTISLSLSTSMSTLATGGVVFGLFGLAFIGGWVERIGAIFENQVAIQIGILSSLLMPTESMWNLASYQMTEKLASSFGATPFSSGLLPSPMMVIYTLAYLIAFLAIGIWNFTRRDL